MPCVLSERVKKLNISNVDNKTDTGKYVCADFIPPKKNIQSFHMYLDIKYIE